MNSAVRCVPAVLGLLSSCTQTEGQCWHDDQTAGNVGAGGAPIVTGLGGAGDVPPGPQDAAQPIPPDCELVPGSECDQSCLAEYDAASVRCSTIQDDAQRRVCQEAAHVAYRACEAGCQKVDDCMEVCKDACDKDWERCRDDCPRGNKTCLAECTEELARCYKRCKEKCK